MAKRRSERSAVYVISVAAELAGVHPQTLRMYERKGLLQPQRTTGNTRRYSASDIARLRRIQELTQREGVNLAGARMVLRLEAQLERARSEIEAMSARLSEMEAILNRELGRTTSRAGDIVPAREARTLSELWIEQRRRDARARQKPIELGPPGTAG